MIPSWQLYADDSLDHILDYRISGSDVILPVKYVSG